MRKRFGAWMARYWSWLALAAYLLGMLASVLNRTGGFRAIEMAFWQSQAQACGTLVVVSMSGSSGDPQAATACFMQAYEHCQVATLGESSSGLDISTTYTFAIEPVPLVGGAHPCSIQVRRAGGGVDAYLQSNYDWVTCAGVEQHPYGLYFSSCGSYGDILVSTE